MTEFPDDFDYRSSNIAIARELDGFAALTDLAFVAGVRQSLTRNPEWRYMILFQDGVRLELDMRLLMKGLP